MPLRFTRGHAATKKMIASCAAQGVGIEGLPDAPRFRFVPTTRTADSFTGREDCGPSGRGGHVLGKSKPKHFKNWTPCRTSADPMYGQPMAGDDDALTEARASYAKGNPGPLREYLAALAAERRAAAEPIQWAMAA